MPDDPTLLSDLMDLMDACIEQGKAVVRGDDVSAAMQYRRSLLALDRVVLRAAPEELPQTVRERIPR